MSIENLTCCGIHELADIDYARNKPEETILEICQDIYNNGNNCAFFLFTDIGKKIAGKNLEKYIIKHKLGTITKSPAKVNPNSGNSLTIWIWAIQKTNLKKHYSLIK